MLIPWIAPPSGRTLSPRAAPLSALLALLLLAPCGSLGALEIGGSFRLGNMAFAHDRPEGTVTFPGNQYQWGFDLAVQQALSDDFSFSSSVVRDLVLRNTVYNTVTYRQSLQNGSGRERL